MFSQEMEAIICYYYIYIYIDYIDRSNPTEWMKCASVILSIFPWDPASSEQKHLNYVTPEAVSEMDCWAHGED